MLTQLETPGDSATVDAYAYLVGGTSVYPDGMDLLGATGDTATVDATVTVELGPVFNAVGDTATVDATVTVIAGAPTEADAGGDSAATDAVIQVIAGLPHAFYPLGDSATTDATVLFTGGVDVLPVRTLPERIRVLWLINGNERAILRSAR